MGGEKLDRAEFTRSGLAGDRAYALADTAGDAAHDPVATAKGTSKWPGILDFRARFLAEPRAGAPLPAVSITLPDGRSVVTENEGAAQLLSSVFGRTVAMRTPTDGAVPRGPFVDCAHVHLVTTSSLRALQEALPQSRIDVRRFRPNIVLDTGLEPQGFLENAWVGATLAIGDQVLLRIQIPCGRCLMTTLPQADLPRDSAILRTLAQQNRLDLGDLGKLPCLGVYAEVLRPGVVRSSDSLRIMPKVD